MRCKFLTLALLFVARAGFAGDERSLQDILKLAYHNNPEILAAQQTVRAENSLVTSEATLDDPVVGVSTIDRNVKTQYGTISQKVRFPIKYIYQAKAQNSRVDSARVELEKRKFEIRAQVISLYYAIYSTQKIIGLTKANMEAVKEFARVAEKKYAAGKSPQGDSMKAHFELTQLELDLIRLKQEEQSYQDNLKAAVNDPSFVNLSLSQVHIETPKLHQDVLPELSSEFEPKLKAHAPQIKSEAYKLKEAEYISSLSKWEFAPDFQLQYQQRIAGDPEDSKIYSVALTVPLWFWKKGSQASAAAAKRMAQEFRLTDAVQKLIAKVKDLKGKVETGAKTLDIYQTSLIPQAQSAYNSTRAAYRANKTSFLDLLDSERSLYRVRTGFYQSLRQYVTYLSQLETQLGFSVSNLEPESEVMK